MEVHVREEKGWRNNEKTKPSSAQTVQQEPGSTAQIKQRANN